MQTLTANCPLNEHFTQVCVWPSTVVGKDQIDEFVKWCLTEFGVRVQYLEEVETKPDETGPGGRNDLFFAVHQEDVSKFAVPRLSYGIRWIEDVYGNKQGCLYPERISAYQSWDAGVVSDPDEDEV